MTRDFDQRVKFVCSWKDPEKQNIGVQTRKREQFSAAYYANELFRDNMVMYWGMASSRHDHQGINSTSSPSSSK